MRTLFVFICFLVSSFFVHAQYHDGIYNSDKIIEDGLLEDDTRYIISELYTSKTFEVDLCLFIPIEGDTWYSLLVRSSRYIPPKGMMVFVFDDKGNTTGETKTLVLNQHAVEKISYSRTSLALDPMFIFSGSGTHLFLNSYVTTKQQNCWNALYNLTDDDIIALFNYEIREYRVAAKSTYNRYSGWYAKSFSNQLKYAKSRVDKRSLESVNRILEDY